MVSSPIPVSLRLPPLRATVSTMSSERRSNVSLSSMAPFSTAMSGQDAELKAAPVSAWERQPCPKCTRSYKFYCPVCFVPVGVPDDVQVPSLALPVQVHVWFQDKIKKSTAPHAKVVAPDDVHVIPFPVDAEKTPQPASYTRENTVVVYPTPDAEVMGDLPRETLEGIRNMVFIDTPWQKAPVVLLDPALEGLRCVKLAKPPHESNFWRYHQAGAGCVSTIEAIQLMLMEYVDAMQRVGAPLPPRAEKTQLADLLFFFELQFTRIVDVFENDPQRYRKPPMDAAEKERQRLLRDQKEAGKKRRLENKKEAWDKIARALSSGEMQAPPRKEKCFNCKKKGHEAKDCPNPCRYCKQAGHFSGKCSMKKVRYEQAQKEQLVVRTKAL